MKNFTCMAKSFVFIFFILHFNSSTAQSLPPYVPSSGIVAWYPFNNNANDESGNGNDGTLYTPVSANDRFSNANSAYSFVTDSILIANPTNFQLTEFTISAWINCFNARFDYEAIFKNFDAIGTDYTGYWFGLYTDVLTFGLYDGATGWTEIVGTTNLNDGQWHHIIATYDGSTGTIYVDGIAEGSAAENITYSPASVTIGNDYLNEFFEGSIDDIGVWNRALSVCEIQNLYAAAIATGTDTRSECAPYMWIDGNTYSTNNNSATYVFPGAAASGCDSMAVLDLTILAAPDVSTTVTDPTITANATGSTFEWIDCNNSNAIIPGETSASFTASSNGSYAVIVDNGNCKDTSACVTIMTTGIDAGQENLRLKLYPNPSSGEFMLELEQAYSDMELTIYSISGAQVATMHYQNKQRATIDFNADSGIYFLEVRANGKTQRLKLIKQ